MGGLPDLNPLDDIQDFIADRLADLRRGFEIVLDPVISTIGEIKATVGGVVGGVQDAVEGIVGDVRGIVSGVVDGVQDSVGDIVQDVKALPSALLSEVEGAFGTVVDTVWEQGRSLVGAIGDEIQGLYELVIDRIEEVLEPFGTIFAQFQGIADRLPGEFGKAVALILEPFLATLQQVQVWSLKVLLEVVEHLVKVAAEFLEPIWPVLREYFADLLEALREAFSIDLGDMEEIFKRTSDMTSSAMQHVIEHQGAEGP